MYKYAAVNNDLASRSGLTGVPRQAHQRVTWDTEDTEYAERGDRPDSPVSEVLDLTPPLI